MELTIPEIPAGVVTLLALFTPYGTALLNGLVHLTGVWKRILSVAVALVIAGGVLVIYYVSTGEPVPQWTGLLLLAVVVSQASYGLVVKGTAKQVEDKVAVASLTRRASRDPHMEDHSIIPAENEDGPTLDEVGGWVEEPDAVDVDDADEPRRGDHAADNEE